MRDRELASGSIIWTMALLAILLLSAFSFTSVPSVGQITAEPDAGQSSEVRISQNESILAYSSSDRWDWQSFADGTGYVDVVLVIRHGLSHESPSHSLLDVLSGSTDTRNLHKLTVALEKGTTKEFSRVFSGLSAHLSLDTVRELSQQGSLVEVYPDIKMSAMVGDNVKQIGADQVWTLKDPAGVSVRGSGVVVAVIDTGVDYTHPDLGGGFGPAFKVIGGYDFYNNDGDPMDDNGHGTHVAGIVAARGGISGVAPDASILAYKVLGPDGSGSMSDVISAIEASMDPNGDGDLSDHADVVSMSLGAEGDKGDPVCVAVESAIEAGIVVVVAAGNSGPRLGTVASPGLAPDAITVGACDNAGILAEFSSRGTNPDLSIKPELSAPGVGIVSTVPYSGATRSSSTGYMSLSGTSMATPHVSGAAALLIQLHPDWSPEQVKSALVTGTNEMVESIWSAGAGQLWVPRAAYTDLFLSDPIVSYGFPTSGGHSVNVTNTGSGVALSSTTCDWLGLNFKGSASGRIYSNSSHVSPSTMNLASGENAQVNLILSSPSMDAPEGYYDGAVHLRDAGHDLRIPFGYVALSRLNVHVLNLNGKEVFDYRGGVWAYSYPDARVSMSASWKSVPTPPASFLVKSGEYGVHSLGHQIFYSSSDPYILSSIVTVNRFEDRNVYLKMTEARRMNIDLGTDEGIPIYVKDFMMYGRYVGEVNVSFLVNSVDNSITGSEVFSLPVSKTVYVSDTDANIGIAFSGFSYTTGMWDFMKDNWMHWYNHVDSNSTEFVISSSADIRYLLSWELPGVSESTSLNLGVVDGKASVYYSKYDIPGAIADIYGGSGYYLAMGGEAAPYIRGSSYVAINQIFSGMTRKTIAQGVFTDMYWPGSIFQPYVEREFYTPDYNNTFIVTSLPGVEVPNAYLLKPVEGVVATERVGSGPFYPSVRTLNTNDSLVLIHPLLRDQSGARVGSLDIPELSLYKAGSLVSLYDLSEHRLRPDPKRVIALTGSGTYTAYITASGFSQICNAVEIMLGFTVASQDPNPPAITGLSMSERFVPGQPINLELSVADQSALGKIQVWSSLNGADSWRSASVTDLGHGRCAASLNTSTTDKAIDLRLKASDSWGNYIEYIASNASLKQVPVSFDLTADRIVIAYSNSSESVLLTGHLTDTSGNPLSTEGAVPLELMVGGRKVGILLDEYISDGSHSHNGSIRFDWHFNPTHIFAGPTEPVDIQVVFDLGIYQSVTRTITLRPMRLTNEPPVISLVSPANNTAIAAGQAIDLEIEDDGPFTVDATVDGASIGQLHAPWNVETTGWNDGIHVLRIVAVDDQSLTTSASFSFDVDAQAPSVRILYPKDGGRVPIGGVLIAEVSDAHLKAVYYSVDCDVARTLASPYAIDMSIWAPGNHSVIITALDYVGHLTSRTVSFEIVNSSIAVQLENPGNGGVMRSGIPITFSVSGSGMVTSRWCTAGVWQELGGLMTIPTDGWFEGVHSIIINSTSDLGGFDQATFTITIDDTSPMILLNSPLNNSFVSPSDSIRFQVFDANIQTVNWTIWDRSGSTAQWETVVLLASPPPDGYFNLGVTVVDKAGNKANASFMFAMDSSPPSVSFANMSNGDAIRPSQQLNFTATDAFLSTVQWAFDSGALATINPSFAINTSLLSGGLHQLTVVASDLSGKKTTANISFYIDAVAPNALITSSPRMTLNATCTVTASVSDDYGVAAVQLFYELRAGGYGSVMMAGYDGVYVAELAPDLMWKGMTIYVLATDKVGNVAESPHMTLQPSTSPFDGNPTLPGSPSGWGAAMWAWIVSTNGLAVLGLIGVIALAGVVLYARRRREDESTERAVKPKPSPRGVSNASPFAELPPPKPIMAASAKQIVDSVKAAAKTVGQVSVPTRVPTAVASGIGAPARAMLLDSIPEITFKPDVKSPEDDIDYGELIERELNTSAWKNSVFGKGIGHSAVSREFDPRLDRPGIISGLKLKQILE